MPKHGYGQLRRLSQYLNVNTAFISQVFKGDKNLSSEQAIKTAEFFDLNEIETEYFLALTQFEKAGSKELREYLQKQISKILDKAKRISENLKSVSKLSSELSSELSDDSKIIFYSDWIYSAIRQLPAIKGFESTEAISQYLGLNKKTVVDAVQILVQNNLLIQKPNGFEIGASRTHLEPDSPLIKTHHLNWRNRAMDKIKTQESNKLHFSFPMTLSNEDTEKVRRLLIKLIEEVDKIVRPSPSETLRCLNIDWFQI